MYDRAWNSMLATLFAVLPLVAQPSLTAAQVIMVVGTPHLTGLDPAPSDDQVAEVVEALAAFGPTQVCVERMSGERIQAQLDDPREHGMTFRTETHGRPIASLIVPAGFEMQAMEELGPAEARGEAADLVGQWEELELSDRIRVIGLQVAGFQFHSAVLNWSWLDAAEREMARESLGDVTVAGLDSLVASVHEVYSVAVPLARRAGIHELCTADALEDETRGMRTAIEHGGMEVLEDPRVQARMEEHQAIMTDAWRPGDGADGLLALLRYTNGDAYAEMDRRLQWETLREFDNEEGAFHRRLMYWHARTAAISAELYRALAQGPEERVLFVVGAAHRAFTEAELRSQPWFNVMPAAELLEERK